MAALNYAQAGVNIEVADKFVEKIGGMAKSTLNKKVKKNVSGYASLYEVNPKQWIAASTDGVGTKLKLAFETNRHDTVGIDLVAMCVNDLLCVGAEPLFFLDYFATGKLELGVAEKVLAGIVEGCRQARSALVGGETAEMPGLYSAGEYDLAGFSVGMVKPSAVLPKDIRVGDSIIGVASSGFHSNGYSLLRKLLPESGTERAEKISQLLVPTKIYVNSMAPLIDKKMVKGLAHITGGGFLNIARLSNQVSYQIKMPSDSELPPIIGWVKDRSGLSAQELFQTFNMGMGMVLIASPKKVPAVLKALKQKGEKAWVLGELVKRRKVSGKLASEILIEDSSGMTTTLLG